MVAIGSDNKLNNKIRLQAKSTAMVPDNKLNHRIKQQAEQQKKLNNGANKIRELSEQ